MDEFQKIVAESYEGGEFNSDQNPEDAGDGLFKFLITELSESEGCDSVEEALRRLSVIGRQIHEVKIAFMRVEEGRTA